MSLEFRQDAVRSFFNVYSNSHCNTLAHNAPDPNNYCPFCTNWRHQECFFFHPSLAAIFLEEIKAYDHFKYRCSNERANDLMLQRFFDILPSHYANMGYPCPNGRLWGCVVDKLEQTFPREVFMMLDIQDMLQKKEVDNQLYIRHTKINERLLASSNSPPPKQKSIAELVEEDFYPEYIPLLLDNEPTCGCLIYFEGNCPTYEEFIREKAIHPSSKLYANFKTRSLPLCEYIDTVRDEFDEDWERAPVCAQTRLRAFVHREYLRSYLEREANEVRLNAAKKEKSAKYKNSKLRSGKPSLVLLP